MLISEGASLGEQATANQQGLLSWQQTRKAYVEHLAPKKPIAERYGPFGTLTTHAMAACEVERLSLKRTLMLAHERSVRQALEDGELVRDEVWSDYPHLMRAVPVSADVAHQ